MSSVPYTITIERDPVQPHFYVWARDSEAAADAPIVATFTVGLGMHLRCAVAGAIQFFEQPPPRERVRIITLLVREALRFAGDELGIQSFTADVDPALVPLLDRYFDATDVQRAADPAGRRHYRAALADVRSRVLEKTDGSGNVR